MKASSTKISKHSSESFSSRYDTRNDLGYGRTQDKFHKPRSLSSFYPYIEEDSLDSDWDDHDTRLAVSKKSLNYKKTDPFAHKKSDPFYFAAGNVKLSDCFYRSDDIISEVESFGNSISPVPGMYKNRMKRSVGSKPTSKSISQKSALRTGSKRGFASAPPDLKYDKKQNREVERIFNLEDLIDKLYNERV